ncbi:hypothetical protein JCM10295v2_004709 [Rhodotorula toruloides]
MKGRRENPSSASCPPQLLREDATSKYTSNLAARFASQPSYSLQITLLLFAGVRSAWPGEPASQLIDLPTSPSPFPLSRLRDHLILHVQPGNEELSRVLERSAWSVDEEMVDEERENEALLKGGETVCPIPPVSGG